MADVAAVVFIKDTKAKEQQLVASQRTHDARPEEELFERKLSARTVRGRGGRRDYLISVATDQASA